MKEEQPLSKEDILRIHFNKYRYASPLDGQTTAPVLEAMEFYAKQQLAASQHSSEGQGEWINVEDELPKKNCNVIVYTDKKGIGIGVMWFSIIHKWHQLKEGAIVTHWQHLPSPPSITPTI